MNNRGLPMVTFGIIVLNGEPFILYNLRVLRPFAYGIIVRKEPRPLLSILLSLVESWPMECDIYFEAACQPLINARKAIAAYRRHIPKMDLYQIITTKQDPELIAALEQVVAELLPEFKRVVGEHPLRTPSRGCVSITEAFWLYALTRSLKPRVIIESGTFEGYSIFFLWSAAPSDARVISFDPFTKPKFRLPGVEYYAMDWTEHNWSSLPGDQTLIFFDDHLHQGRRLWQAYRQDIRHLVFHDNYVTPVQSHIPIRYVNLLGLVKHYYIFDRLRSDPIFCDTSANPQAYRWLTYVELEDRIPIWRLLLRRWRYWSHVKNPYKIR
jgi:hypothetical protein